MGLCRTVLVGDFFCSRWEASTVVCHYPWILMVLLRPIFHICGRQSSPHSRKIVLYLFSHLWFLFQAAFQVGPAYCVALGVLYQKEPHGFRWEYLKSGSPKLARWRCCYFKKSSIHRNLSVRWSSSSWCRRCRCWGGCVVRNGSILPGGSNTADLLFRTQVERAERQLVAECVDGVLLLVEKSED